jgi:AraC-like DNA-binding protein
LLQAGKVVINVCYESADSRNRHGVAYAVELIRSGETEKMSLGGIAMQSGFSSRTTFFIAFKNEMGVSPSQYLENAEPYKQFNQIVS